MGVSVHKIKKWVNMLLGKSVYHVHQGPGTVYSKTEVAGYYNDLTEKVLRFGTDEELVPRTTVDTGETIYFSIAVFQYGLAAYDLYLQTKEEKYLKKTIACADWAVDHQEPTGAWDTFSYQNQQAPYSSMAQGEGISLLIRAYIATQNEEYLKTAAAAKEYMLLPLQAGGTAGYEGEDVLLYESTDEPVILNGWIFSLWGLYDYWKHTKDASTKEILDRTVDSLVRKLDAFDMKYWSKYDAGTRICSPFYHELHIAQLRVMYDLFEEAQFLKMANKWESYQNSFWKAKFAFVCKALQKIKE